MAEKGPKAFAYNGASISKALIPSLQHRHAGVRVLGLKALCNYLLIDVSGLDDVLETLWILIQDKAPSVRQEVYFTVSEWQLKLMDRYSLTFKYLPLLLAGLSDELPQLSDYCRQKLFEIGEMYENEWPDRVRKEMEVLPLSGQSLGNFFAKVIPEYPRIGIKHLFRDNTQKTVDKLVEKMSDWNVEVRRKSALMLSSLVWIVGEYITGYIGAILPTLCRICSGDEDMVVKAVCFKLNTGDSSRNCDRKECKT